MSIRVVFITQEDPFYVRLFFAELFQIWTGAAELVAVVIAPAMGQRSILQLARQMFGLYGVFGFVRLGFRYVWYRLAVRLAPLLGIRRSYSVAQECHNNGIRAVQVQNVNDPEFLDWLKSQRPDLVVSVAAPQIFRQSLIDTPRLGCINIHNSLLPKYRGMLPNFWQLYHGETVVGATIHRINPALDDGEILLQQQVAVLPGESLESLICRTKRNGAHLMVDAIARAMRNELVGIPNDRSQASHFSFPKRADAREFRRRGNKFF